MSTPAEPVVTELEATNWGDPTGGGILAAMESFDFDAPNPAPAKAEPAKVEPAKADPAKAESAESAKAQDAAVKPDGEPAKASDDLPVLPNSEFFNEPAKEPTKAADAATDEPAFDEKEFDAQTDEAARTMDPKAMAKFKELRGELKTFKQREASKLVPEDTRRELEELRLAAAERDGLKERLKEVSSQSAKLAMENEPDYKRLVLDPVVRTYDEADKLAEATGVDPDALRTLIRERDLSKQEQMLEANFGDKSLLVQAKVATLVESYNTALANRAGLLENAEAKIAEARNQRVEQERRTLAEQHLAVQKHQKKIIDEWKPFIPGFTGEDGEVTAAYKALVDKSLSIDFSTATANDMARAAFFGSITPQLVKDAILMQRELAAYRKADGKSLETSPKPGDSIVPTPSEKAQPKTFMEMAAQDIG